MPPDDQGERIGRGRPQSPLPRNLSPAERAFLERMRETNARAGDTLAEVSEGLDRLVAGGSSPHTAASTSELSKMLSGKRSFRPSVITGLHALARARSDSRYEVKSEIAESMRLFYGWLEIRDPARLRLHRLEERLARVEGSRRAAERKAEELTWQLHSVRQYWDEGVRRLTALTGGALDDLPGQKDAIVRLAARIRASAREAGELEAMLEHVWRDIRSYVGEGLEIIRDISELIEHLADERG